jgi:glutamyl-tRNA synthetase
MSAPPAAGPLRGRYAPSPTGSLHLGNLRTALLAWLFARHAGGQFVLRVEDLDLPRVRPGATARMLADLRWLGLEWDEGPDVGGPYGPYFQSARQALYDAALAHLRAAELVYPCYCTRAELAQLASAPQAGDDAPRYPGTCRYLSAAERRAREAEGRHPALRFRAPEAPIRVRDTLHGEHEESVADTVGDFLVRRSDGIVAYQLAVVVDDALMGMTQIVRGADLLPSTARQLALYAALGYRAPREYIHVPLLLDETGARMAKRDSALGLDPLRERGARPEDVLGVLAASCGLWPADAPAPLAELLTAFTKQRADRSTQSNGLRSAT